MLFTLELIVSSTASAQYLIFTQCIRFIFDAGCEYGDTVTWCSSQNLDASSCQPQSDTGKKCCGSCHKKFPDGIPTDGAPPSGGEHTNVDATAKCPQGDTAGAAHCAAMKEAPHQCYQSESTCCATCEKLHTGNAGTYLSPCFGDMFRSKSGSRVRHAEASLVILALCVRPLHSSPVRQDGTGDRVNVSQILYTTCNAQNQLECGSVSTVICIYHVCIYISLFCKIATAINIDRIRK